MPEPLRALIVSDLDRDAEILVAELRRGGFDTAFQRVCSGEEMQSALDQQAWDVVLAKQATADFEPIAALALLRRSRLDIPFIVVAETITGADAIRLMKSGAHDVILMDSHARLAPAVERELREAEERRARRRAEEDFRETGTKLRTLFDAAPVAVIGYVEAGEISDWNGAAERIFGWSAAEVVGKPHPWQSEDGREQIRALANFAVSGEWIGGIDLTRARKDGRMIDIRSSVAPLRDPGGRVTGWIEIVADLSERKGVQELLHRLTHYDGLTGLPNRTHYCDLLQGRIAAREDQGSGLAIMHVQLHRVEDINSSLGVPTGNKLLQAVARRLAGWVAAPDICARIGGDKFAVVMSGAAGLRDLRQTAEGVIELFAKPIFVETQEVYVQVSAGVAFHPADGRTATALIQNADVAMRRASDQGPSHYEFYAAEMSIEAVEHLSIETGLRKALEEDHFQLHYQPQVDITTGRIAGVEALIRWIHPTKGQLSPATFIPIAEESGLIIPLGEWVLYTACAQARAWQAQGLPATRVAVNLSVHQLRHRNVLDVLRRALDESGLDPQYLELELTETELVRTAEESIAALHSLKDMGISLSIDDFGTGYSSLSYLNRFPVDEVKIDKSFVGEITSNPEDAAIASAIIAMAHSLDLRVVAEGVETEGQLGFLHSHDCDIMQGYYFSRPVPSQEFERMLAEGKRLTLSDDVRKKRIRTLLIVDDDETIILLLKRLLSDRYPRILATTDPKAAFELLATNRVGVMISDQNMPGMTGIELLSRVKELYPETVRMVLTGQHDVDVVMEAINRGAIYKFITKPWKADELLSAIRSAFQLYESLQRGKGKG